MNEFCEKKENCCAPEKEMKNSAPMNEYMEVMPLVDILEGEDAVTMWFEVPGANSQSVSIEVKDRIMEMCALSTLRRGGKSIMFKREFQLSDLIDIPMISAKTMDGVLTLTLPKSERAKVHKIKID